MAEFDLVVFGATGFAGSLAAKYLTRRTSSEPLKIAVAGRDQDKLAKLAEACELTPEVIIADAGNVLSIDAMVARTGVVLNFAGPFALHAEPIIAACARNGCHYLDITGETPFVRSMIEKYQAEAEVSGAKLIPCSGFDSVPGDLAAFAALQQAKEQGIELDEMSCYYEARGGVNGGTVTSLLHIAEDTSIDTLFDPKMMIPDPQWTAAPRPKLGPRFEPALDRWSAPFFMAPINQAVVYRSAYLRHLEDGDQPHKLPFSYEERMLVGRPFGAAQAGVATGLLAGLGVALRSHVGRQVIEAMAPKPGEGPSPEEQNKGYFKTQLIGRSKGAVKVKVSMERDGDPGNKITSILASESAKLAAHADFATKQAGFLTPSVAFGAGLIEHLRLAGFTITSEAVA